VVPEEVVSIKSRIAAWLIARRIAKAAGLNRKERKVMMELIKKLLGASWVTTVLGWLATYLGVTSTVGWFKPDGTVNWWAVGLAVVGAAFARKVKGDQVTGGKVSQPTVVNIPVLPENPSALAPEVKPELVQP
jgi:hypothetical protein